MRLRMHDMTYRTCRASILVPHAPRRFLDCPRVCPTVASVNPHVGEAHRTDGTSEARRPTHAPQRHQCHLCSCASGTKGGRTTSTGECRKPIGPTPTLSAPGDPPLWRDRRLRNRPMGFLTPPLLDANTIMCVYANANCIENIP